MIGKTISHYRIIEKLGEGGMGVVYRAHDTRLGRHVALKFLPHHIASDENDKQRFILEAKAASALDHPNICTIHEIDETPDHNLFIVMSYYEGETLKKRIEQGPLKTAEAIDLAIQLAKGLAKAHAHGIIHRDIKPANIIVTAEGTAKILDFGLAKLGGQTLLTKTGTTVGTAAYMSPEQAQGGKVDQRSDIWSLGVVLYEMLSGQRPFAGEYEQAVIYSIINEEPPPIGNFNPDVPPALEAIVKKALQKNKEDRYQQLDELLSALGVLSGTTVKGTDRRRVFTGHKPFLYAAAVFLLLLVIIAVFFLGSPVPEVQAIESIAVLPLENLSGDVEQEYLVEGIHDALITDLAKLGGLKRVIARPSVMRYKGKDISMREIARELNVDAVVTGAVVRIGNQVRITAQLINPSTEDYLWAERYEREMRDVLSLQNEIVTEIAKQLELKLLPDDQIRLASVRTVNPEAYDAYLKGSYHWKKVTPEEIDIAERYFELALEKDPSYAPAYHGLACVWLGRQQILVTPTHEAGPKSKAAALQAIALDENSAEAYEALALVRTWTDWNWDGAETAWRRALELNPNAANAHAYYAHFLTIMGRTEEAVRHSERALELDPFSALFHALYSLTLYRDRRYDEAIAAAHNARQLQPGIRVATHVVLHYAPIMKGVRDKEKQLADQRKLIAHDAECLAAFDQGLAESGYEGAQRGVADVLAARYERDVRVERGARGIAIRYLDIGDVERAIDWYEKAIEARDPNMPYEFNDPFNWDLLRDNPRFRDLMGRLNIPPRQN